MTTVNLSNQQQKIVNLDEGAYLITASAGSGKTRVLTERIKRLSEKADNKILAITFTNKATDEIKERIGNSEQIQKQVFVGTFHSFCQSILEVRFKKLGYEKMPHIFENDADRIELIKRAINSVPYFKNIYDDLEPKKKSSYTYKALQFISTVKRELIPPEILIEKSTDKELEYLYDEYQELLKSNNAIDFDDVIRLIYELLINNQAIANLYQKSYNYICIDECQDLNKIQYYLLKALCGEQIKNVMLMGDPNQSIYGFNGASSKFMEENFIKDFQAKKVTLVENYRCAKSIIKASNILMGLEVETNEYVIEGEFNIQPCSDEDSEAQFVTNKIKELIRLQYHKDIEGKINYNNISVLARNKFVFKNIEKCFEDNKIPYYLKSGNKPIQFTSSEMRIFELFFRVTLNPLDNLHQKKLEKLLSVDDIFDSGKLISSKFPVSNDIRIIVEKLNIDNFLIQLKTLEEKFKLIENDDNKNLALNELQDLKKLFTSYKKQKLKPTLNGFKSSMALGMLNSQKDEQGVCLSTVHTMKGQESEIVFLIGMDEGTFPDYRTESENDLKQEKNNAYVAFTRAKRLLYVSYPKKRLMPWGKTKTRTISCFLRNFDIT